MISDIFENYIESSDLYIDKSLLIKECIDNANKVILLTRPRRFGKTLNMTMLKAFFESKDEKSKLSYAKYFEGLQIWQCGEEYLSHFGKYPVIFMTLKDVEGRTWTNCYSGLKTKIANVFKQHKPIINSLQSEDKEFYNNILFFDR